MKSRKEFIYKTLKLLLESSPPVQGLISTQQLRAGIDHGTWVEIWPYVVWKSGNFSFQEQPKWNKILSKYTHLL